MEVLAAANRELTQEIKRRKVVEKALKKSEQHSSRLLKQSLKLQGQLRHLSHQVLQVQEEERKQISRELHDDKVGLPRIGLPSASAYCPCRVRDVESL